MNVFAIPVPASAHPSFAALVSPAELGRAQRFKSGARADLYLVGHALLRAAIGGYLNLPPLEIAFSRGPNGKPFIQGQNLQFSYSSSVGWVMIGCALTVEIGVDVERFIEYPEALLIAKSFFASSERAQLELLSEPALSRAFVSCWTRKEAYRKAVGDGLFGSLSDFEVSVDQQTREVIRRSLMVNGTGNSNTWSLYDVAPSQDCAGSLVVAACNWSVRRWQLESAAAALSLFTSMQTSPNVVGFAKQ